jgi:hypothetical protein
MHRRFVCFAFACAVMAALIHTTAAQPAGNQDDAKMHFLNGVGHMQADDYQAAIVELEKSLELLPNPNTHMNLGVCHESLGDLLAARRHFRAAERMAEEKGAADIAKEAAAKARALDSQLARLIIRVSAQAELSDVEVTHNGERVDSDRFGTYIYVAPGTQRITARAVGYQPYEIRVRARQGKEAMVEIPVLEPVVDPVVAVEPVAVIDPIPEGKPGNTRRLVGYAGVGVGAVAVLGGVGMGWMTIRARNDAFDSGACNRDTLLCSVEGQAEMDTAHDRALYANILVGAGVVVAGAGLVLWLTAPKQRESLESSALVPLVSPDQVGLALSGRF